MRATTLLNCLLGLPGAAAVDPGSWQVEPGGGEIGVRVRLTRRLLVCKDVSIVSLIGSARVSAIANGMLTIDYQHHQVAIFIKHGL